jgi:DNA-binding response OmpR family regulator
MSAGVQHTPLGTVLLVEDEENIASIISAFLEREGYHVVWVPSGGAALTMIESGNVNLVLLDLGLPDIDGFEVCRRIRAKRDLPIIMLTARGDEVDRVEGFDVGADDYIAKPFSLRELMARIRAVLRRSSPKDSDEPLVLGDVILDRRAHEARVGGQALDLRGKEFDLLACLIENQGRLLSREDLLDLVWGIAFPAGTRTVDVHVAKLRSKLGRPDMIQTVRGLGYKAVDGSADGGESELDAGLGTAATAASSGSRGAEAPGAQG